MITNQVEGLQNQQECPAFLIRSGTDILLYTDPNGEPMRFSNLDGYIEYVEQQRKRGNDCPVLSLQEESQDKYGSEPVRIQDQDPEPVIDSTDDRNPGMYPSFDPYGLQVGRYTKVDQVHDSTANEQLSDNPMDTNWGGVEHTQRAVDSGEYDENRVIKPVYYNPKDTHIPGLYSNVSDPRSYTRSTGP